MAAEAAKERRMKVHSEIAAMKSLGGKSAQSKKVGESFSPRLDISYRKGPASVVKMTSDSMEQAVKVRNRHPKAC
jgi:hypothetical protein